MSAPWIPRAVPKPQRSPKRAPKTPVKSKRSKKSGGHLFYAKGQVSLSRRAFVRKHRCIATGAKTGQTIVWQSWMPEGWKEVCPYVCKVIAAHVGSRGHGENDEADLVPMDAWIHQYVQHSWGWPAFERRLRLIPRKELAAMYEAKYQAANRNAERSA